MDKVLRETQTVINDGLHEIFVNTAVDDGSKIANLMSCFTKTEFENPNFPNFTSETKRLKETEGGASTMCAVMQKYMDESQNQLATLINRLLTSGRSQDALLATTDPAYRKKLFSEFGI